jgi:putative DNA primase/helicase
MHAEFIAKALGGFRAGASWMARCPAHDDRTPSLSIREADGKVLVRCHARCEQEQVIAALRSRGLWTERGLRSYSRHPANPIVDRRSDQDDAKRSKDALAIWQSTIPARGTLVETYLLSRGLHLPSPMLRFHAGLKHPSGDRWPAMVALISKSVGSPRRTAPPRQGPSIIF